MFGLVLFAGLGGYASIVFGTIARGKSIPQEILVARQVEDLTVEVETPDEVADE